MRHAIGTAPKDGNVVIPEDDASGTCDVAHGSAEAGECVGENGEPSKVTPSHSYPVPRDKYLPQEHDGSSNPSQVGPSAPPARWLFAASSITATLIAAALIGLFFEQEPWLPSQDSRQATLPELQQPAEADQASAPARPQEAVQVKQAVEASAPEARQSLEMEQRTEVLANELAEARRAINELNLQLRAEAANSAQLLLQEHQDSTAARQELTATTEEHHRALEEERARGAALAGELAMARLEIETQAVQLRNASEEETGQLKQAEAAQSAQSLEQEREKTAALAQEAAAARQELTASTATHRQALDEERARSAALASELATAQREIEMQTAQLRKASDEREQLKQAEAAKSAQSLEQEREKTAALAQDATAARQELTVSSEQHHRALEEEHARGAALASELALARLEIETNVALLKKARDDAAQFKQTAEKTTAELQQERDRTEALSGELTMARQAAQRAIDAGTTLESTANSPITQMTQVVQAAAPEQPASTVAQGGPEVARLMVRARALLDQGNIGAARIVLGRAAEMGSAQANFMLAETYDPVILSAWGTYGTRGDATKARELYAKAHTGGIQEAKTRFDALNQ